MKTPNKWSIGVLERWSAAVSDQADYSSTPLLQLSITPLLRWALPALLLFGVSSRCLAQCCQPVITNQPQSQTIAVGGSVTFSVGVYSPTATSYQWRFNGTSLLGATGTSYTILNVQ